MDEFPEFPRDRARNPAPADRDRRGRRRPCQCPRALSLPLHAGGRRESLQMRLPVRSGPGLRPRARLRRGLHGPDLRPADGPFRSAGRGAAGRLHRPRPAAAGESSAAVAARVAAARAVQARRYAGHPGWANADAEGGVLEEVARRTPKAALCCTRGRALRAVRARLSPGAARRAHHRRSRRRRDVRRPHVAEAVSFRLAPPRHACTKSAARRGCRAPRAASRRRSARRGAMRPWRP